MLVDWRTKREKETDKEINRIYSKLSKDFLTELGIIYSKFEKDGKLTYADMVKYSRLDKFLQSLTVHINRTSKELQNLLYSSLEEDYSHSYLWIAWALESSINQKIGYSKITRDQLDAAIHNPISGLKLSDTLEKNRRDIIYKIKNEVTQSLANGNTYKQTADLIKTSVNNDYEKSVTIARTELHRVTEQGTLESAKRAHSQGIIMIKIWRNMNDSRVRKSSKANHQMLEGQEKPVDKPYNLGGGKLGDAPGNTGYPHHDIRCRCYNSYRVITVEAPKKEVSIESNFNDYKKAYS